MSESQRSLWHGPTAAASLDGRSAANAASESAPTDASTSATVHPAAARWPALFAGGSAREILSRIVQSDPLCLRDHVALRMRTEGYLLDADRVHLRALARCARAAVRYRGRPELGEWLAEIVDESIAELLCEDHEATQSQASAESTHAGAFSALARPLGLDPEAMRSACVLFNRLPVPERRAFFDLVIEGRELDAIAHESRESATEIARRARRALDVLLSAQTKKSNKQEEPS